MRTITLLKMKRTITILIVSVISSAAFAMVFKWYQTGNPFQTYGDSKKADGYIQKLAGIYRYILDHEEIDLISLDEEITFVKQYFDLQKERTGNKAQLDVDIKNADKFRAIPVSLQILVENALKHNSMSEECPLKIHIDSDNEYVTVSNGIQRKNIINHSAGTGLSNLKERAKLITGKEIIIIQKNNTFVVKLPILKS